MDESEEIINQYTAEADAGVSFGGLFSALTLFFAGLLISNYASFPEYVRVPLLFLIISTFGFIYATLIYANATGKLNSKSLMSCKKGLNTADILSEFMGVYPLLISVPLVIPIVTNDIFLISSVFLADALGMIIYQLSGFSIISKYYPKSHTIITGFIITLMFTALVLLRSSFQIPLMLLVLLTFIVLISISTIAVRRPTDTIKI